MKKGKLVTIILAVAMALCLASCSSLEGDAKKLAKQHYELEQIGNNVGSRSNMYTGKAKVVYQLELKMWEKYSKEPKTKEKFQKVFDEELKKLKAK